MNAQYVEILVPTDTSTEATRLSLLFMQTSRIRNTKIHNPIKHDGKYLVRIDFDESEGVHEEEC